MLSLKHHSEVDHSRKVPLSANRINDTIKERFYSLVCQVNSDGNIKKHVIYGLLYN